MLHWCKDVQYTDARTLWESRFFACSESRGDSWVSRLDLLSSYLVLKFQRLIIYLLKNAYLYFRELLPKQWTFWQEIKHYSSLSTMFFCSPFSFIVSSKDLQDPWKSLHCPFTEVKAHCGAHHRLSSTQLGSFSGPSPQFQHLTQHLPGRLCSTLCFCGMNGDWRSWILLPPSSLS